MSTDTAIPTDRPSRRRGRKVRTRGQRVRRAIGWTLLAVVLVTGGTGWWLYDRLNSNLGNGIDLDKALGDDRPEKLPTSGQNLLILGSDTRSGENADLAGGDSSGLADTTMVVHIPEGRSKAVSVSIPRDTLVTRPECPAKDGSTLPAKERVMFNSLYPTGGPACVLKTVEHMSGVRIDHYIEVDFAGFASLVDAIGGVTVEVDQPIKDSKTGLDLSVGSHRLNGRESLAFVRTRHGVGDGSDLGRIGLQQQFMLALLAEVRKQDLLGSPTKAYKIANAATKSLTTDSAISSLTSLAEFGRSMQGVNPDTMETLMLPVEYDKLEPARVVAVEPRASALWKAIKEDGEIPESAKKSPASGG
ncbi:LCP family protein [Streptomyces pactum]|uniref:Transcriptional regulator n=1 Tax=Streptomyces pactum TaxID=68249 RepID=A0A1S6J7Q5_9ACTN|nr:LCP family protein [Streptomyces pactum]AQS67809.1 transcriptional regulator [Streptomyces pactum]